MHDREKNDTINRNTMLILCQELGFQLNYHEMEAAFLILDEENHDAIDMEEFLIWFRNRDLFM